MRIHSIVRSLFSSVIMLFMPAISLSQIAVSVRFGPPPIPVYEQPLCPGDGYIWVPGYWAWSEDLDDYFWVPGTWVMAPQVGFLWTPGYWAWNGGAFVFFEGYWGPVVGFYGGINYGFGYFGEGYEGGRWEADRFYYNRAVTNVNVTNITNVYNTTVVNNNNHVSFNGGEGGVTARPTSQQEAAAHERHIGPVAGQTQQLQAAHANNQMRASVNQGRPPIAATPRPGGFSEHGVVPAKEAGGAYNPPSKQQQRGNNGQPGNNEKPGTSERGGSDGGGRTVIHPKDLPPYETPAAPNTGNPKADQKYQQQQQKMQAKQEQERQKLQEQQDREHQQMQKQKANDTQLQQMEQRHQQQTQQLQQKHDQQRQNLQEKMGPPPNRG